MASLDFPSNPTNNQTYALNGVTYYYNAAIGAWLTQLSTMNLSTSSNTQVLFNDASLANGSSGLTYNKSANTLYANTVNVSGYIYGNGAYLTGLVTGALSNSISNFTYTSNLSVTGNADFSLSTGYFSFPVGTTAQRPATPAKGMARWNTTLGYLEYYNGTDWYSNAFEGLVVEYLVIAGGGAGGAPTGGGGAGGYRCSVVGESSGGGASAESKLTLTTASTYTITIGAGGTGVGYPAQGNPGSDSSIAALVVSKGGGSGTHNGLTTNSNGGSGGGGGYSDATGGTGTSGQGYAGGGGVNGGSYPGGGGGGAGAVGTNATSGSQPGNGGTGVYSSITGSSIGRAGGGGGGSRGSGVGSATEGGAGGTGGGTPTAATTNTGGGGGGGGWGSGTSGNGGSGVVIIRYPGSQRCTGGTVTTAGGYTIHTFTTSGTLTT